MEATNPAEVYQTTQKTTQIITEFLFRELHSCDLDLFSECFGERMA